MRSPTPIISLIGLFFFILLSLNVQADELDDLAEQGEEINATVAAQGDGAALEAMRDDFSGFAGSPENAEALVNGLRNGMEITISTEHGEASSATFTPSTGTMGYGDVFISLALAKQQLEANGITEPSAEQIQMALMGAEDTPFGGILSMRQQGMGWGQIAHSMDLKLGPVVSGMRSANKAIHAQVQAHEGSDKPEHPNKPEHPDKPEHPGKPEHPEMPDMPEQSHRPDKPEHSNRPER